MAKAAAKRRSPATRTVKASGRSLTDFEPLLAAEEKLLAACRMGELANIGTGKRPETMTDGNRIRPGFIRFLALGGDDRAPLHEKGIQVIGAWIDGGLDLGACHCMAPLWIHHCCIDGDVIVQDATLSNFSLEGTAINALQGDGLTTSGDVHLRRGFRASREVRLLGARIGGQLSCKGGRFEPKKGKALSCDRAVITGGILLDDGFQATGEVRLLGARIGGDLGCSGGAFEPREGNALTCDKAKISGALFFREVAKITGRVSFAVAEVNALADDRASWALAPELRLDGFRYDRIVEGPTDAATRIAWLKMQFDEHLNNDFRPQPWEQLIKVLRDMGHDGDARAVAMEKQRMLRAAGKIPGILWPLHCLYGVLAGYGHRPMNTVAAMLLAWAFASMAFDYAEQRGLMAPASPIIQANPLISAACGGAHGNRETLWTKCKELPQEYTTFNPMLYSLDLVLPLVDLQQDRDWAPIVTEDDGVTAIGLGVFTRFVMWFEILFGWGASLLLVAVLGNLVKKD